LQAQPPENPGTAASAYRSWLAFQGFYFPMMGQTGKICCWYGKQMAGNISGVEHSKSGQNLAETNRGIKEARRGT
jgi:hypothetical protein